MNNNGCPKCGFNNDASAKYCVSCGSPLNKEEEENKEIKSENAEVRMEPVVKSKGNFNYLKYLFYACLKPYDNFKLEEENLNDIKNVSILGAIVIGFLTILNLISTMFNAVKVTSIWTGETRWVFENLKNINFIKVIGQNILLYAFIIIGIAGIYYLGSLIIKKNSNFVKLVASIITALIPLVVILSIISPIIGMIYAPLGVITSIIGIIYFLVIVFELVSDLITIDNKNLKIYFHTACIATFLIVTYIFIYNLLIGIINSGINSLL